MSDEVDGADGENDGKGTQGVLDFFFFLLRASAARGCECVAGGALKSEEVRKLNEFV